MHRAVSSPDQFPPSLHEIENFFLSQSMGHLRGFLMNCFALLRPRHSFWQIFSNTQVDLSGFEIMLLKLCVALRTTNVDPYGLVLGNSLPLDLITLFSPFVDRICFPNCSLWLRSYFKTVKIPTESEQCMQTAVAISQTVLPNAKPFSTCCKNSMRQSETPI